MSTPSAASPLVWHDETEVLGIGVQVHFFDADEVGGALAADQLVVMGAEHGTIGRVDHALVGAALSVGASVYPAATSSSPFGRAARLEIGPASKSARKRRGPLSELELADQVRVDIAMLLDELGELNTGTPLDWLPLSGLGGA